MFLNEWLLDEIIIIHQCTNCKMEDRYIHYQYSISSTGTLVAGSLEKCVLPYDFHNVRGNIWCLIQAYQQKYFNKRALEESSSFKKQQQKRSKQQIKCHSTYQELDQIKIMTTTGNCSNTVMYVYEVLCTRLNLVLQFSKIKVICS